jgi:23S rRNA G2445 N2-methylase RlmL
MSIWEQKSRILVTCPRYVSPLTTEELAKLGFPAVDESETTVATAGTLSDVMTLNLHLRTAQRVLFLIDEFAAGNAGELYGRMVGFPWERLIHEDDYITVTSVVDNETITDSRFVNVRAKDAVVDRIRKKCGRRPDSGPGREKVVIHLYWKLKSVSVYLDTSGEPLSKRGYRKIPLHAPMQETLAAAVVLSAGWDGNGVLVNPMCGSGTLAIEAALIAAGKAPGFTRSNFGFMHIRGFNPAPWKDLLLEAHKAERPAGRSTIIATDISKKAVLSASKNAKAAGVGHMVAFSVCDYTETEIPDESGIVVINPEYGYRLGDVKVLEEVYRGIGDFFKKRCRGYRGYIFTGNLELAKKVGLRTRRRLPFYNGDIPCRLLEYDLYEGSRKSKHIDQIKYNQKETGDNPSL